MYNTLKTLWFDYFSDTCAKLDTPEEHALAARLSSLSDTLKDALSSEQKALLESYTICSDDLQAIHVEKAFIKGVHVTTSFLLEALRKAPESV